MANWVVITSIYVLAALAVYHRLILYAAPPDESIPEHISSSFEIALVLAINVAILMVVWILTRKYTQSLVAEKSTAAASGSAR